MSNPSELVALLEKDYEYAVSLNSQDIRQTLLAGLNWETNYWVDLSLVWIEQGAKIDSEVIECLHSISKNMAFPKATRHKAMRLLSKHKSATYNN